MSCHHIPQKHFGNSAAKCLQCTFLHLVGLSNAKIRQIN